MDGHEAPVSPARLERARQEMARQGIDLLVVGPSPDLAYLTRNPGHLSERLSLLLVPKDGEATYVVPRFEAPLLGRQRGLAAIRTWDETDNPAAIVAEVAGPVAGKTVAVADQLWSVFLLRLQAAMPGARWIGSGDLLRPLRMAKDADEVATMREAARRTDVAWEAFRHSSIVGLSEREAIAKLLELTAGQGLDVSWGICASGPNAASPHHVAGDRAIEPGDSVVFDWGGLLDGYHSDMTRTVWVGPDPSPEYVTVYETVLAANRAALAAVRPGVACEAIDRAARDVIEAAGYGEAFIHRTGHGLGLDIHEEPYLLAGNALPLEPGMVFSDEPGIYLAGKLGVRVEDTVVCTETGGEYLSHARRDLTTMA